eukprot:SAG31_NODE_2434_length_5705_cov_6.754014_6_plen_65_part_00
MEAELRAEPRAELETARRGSAGGSPSRSERSAETVESPPGYETALEDSDGEEDRDSHSDSPSLL